MIAVDLDKELSGHVFAFVFIMCRLSTVIFLLPGFGETYVSQRTRLMLAVAMSALLLGPLMPIVPAIPNDIPELARILVYEMVVGVFYGTLIRLTMSVLETVGFIIALQTGLSNAVVLNPALATQSPLPSAFLSVVGVTLVFVTGLDHFLLQSMVATYDIFPPGGSLMPGDMAQSYTEAMSRSFLIGVELSLPFLVIGLLMYTALGLMQRLMPQVQLFLVMIPIQIWGGLFLLSLSIAGIMTLWLRYVDQAVTTFMVR